MPQIDDVGTSFSCRQCSERFFTRTDLSIHEQNRHGFLSSFLSFCEKLPDRQSEDIPEDIKVLDMELCDMCGHCADNPKDLKDHKKKEHPVTRVHTYKCKICQQSFASVTERRIHVDQEHKEHKKVKCEICEMEFHSQARKKMHVDMMHGDTYLECDYCDKRFTKRGLKRHVTRVHSSVEKVLKNVEQKKSKSSSENQAPNTKTHKSSGPSDEIIYSEDESSVCGAEEIQDSQKSSDMKKVLKDVGKKKKSKLSHKNQSQNPNDRTSTQMSEEILYSEDDSSLCGVEEILYSEKRSNMNRSDRLEEIASKL